MGYLNLIISSDKTLTLDQNCLLIKDGERVIFRYAVEDLDCIVCDYSYTLISMPLLSRLSESNVAVILCGKDHLPGSVLLPYHTHSRYTQNTVTQRNISQPLRKRLWQAIVKSKISNQSECLELIGKDDSSVRTLVEQVQSGDVTNIEAEAARKYFVILFGEDFTRGQENFYNSALNYGYAVLRGFVARSIAAHGLDGSMGLQHCSKLNAWNLADDCIEPFRAIVDLKVISLLGVTLMPEHKKVLIDLMQHEILSGNELHSVSNAIDRLVESLCACLNNNNVELTLPKLIPLRTHIYD